MRVSTPLRGAKLTLGSELDLPPVSNPIDATAAVLLGLVGIAIVIIGLCYGVW